MPTTPPPLSYRSSGVDIDAGDRLVENIKPFAKRTMRPEVLAGIGGFGALVELPKRFREPVLVASTDGVGTKLKLAFQLDRHDTIGIDLVAMSVNDILVQGAEPLFFLDYFVCESLDVAIATDVIRGIARGCELAGCALTGGETAEHPKAFIPGEYDLAGFAVGVVEKSKAIDGRSIREGDVLLGLASSGPHSNGFSLIRRILEVTEASLSAPLPLSADDANGVGASALRDEENRAAATASGDSANRTGAITNGRATQTAGITKSNANQTGAIMLGDALLEPTRIYVKPILELLKVIEVKGMAHITGGGLLENVHRMFPKGLVAAIERASWPRPAIFDWLQRAGNLDEQEMLRTFNCGIGMVLVVDPADAGRTLTALGHAGERVYTLGRVRLRNGDEPQTQVT